MQAKFATTGYSKALHWGDMITCMYLLLALGLLHHNDLLYKLGRYDNIYIIAVLAAAEIIKHFIYASQKAPTRKTTSKDFFRNSAVLALALTVFYVTSVLLGAPVFSKFEETFMFSLMLTVFTALPACLHVGPDKTINLFLSLTSLVGDEISKLFIIKVRYPIFGAWLGATVIPLDWDRPWQEWPIPCYLGAFAGYFTATATTSVLQFWDRRNNGTKKTGKYTL